MLSYVTPGAVHHLNFGTFDAHRRLPVAVCLCEESAKLSAVTADSLCRLYIHTGFAFACVLYAFSVQCTIHDSHSASASTADHATAYLAIANGSLVTRTAVSLTVAKFRPLLFS